MSKKSDAELRAKYTELIMEKMKELDEDVMRTASGAFAFPVVDSEGEDSWIEVTIKVPTGSRDGDPYDGYSLAEDYQANVAETARRKAEADAKKAAKIARDEKMRAQKAKNKEAHAAKVEG